MEEAPKPQIPPTQAPQPKQPEPEVYVQPEQPRPQPRPQPQPQPQVQQQQPVYRPQPPQQQYQPPKTQSWPPQQQLYSSENKQTEIRQENIKNTLKEIISDIDRVIEQEEEEKTQYIQSSHDAGNQYRQESYDHVSKYSQYKLSGLGAPGLQVRIFSSENYIFLNLIFLSNINSYLKLSIFFIL